MDDLVVTDTPVPAGKRTARSSLPIRICFRNTPYSTDTILENEYLRAVVDQDSGYLISLFDKQSGVELLAAPACVPVVVADPSDTWSHGVASFRNEVARFAAGGKVQVVEQGPVRKVIRATCRLGDSIVEQTFSLRTGARQIEVAVRVVWHEQWQMLKLAFPLALVQSVPTSESPYGQTVRASNGEEEPTQQWVDVTGTAKNGKPAGVALLNDAKYGYDVLETTGAKGATGQMTELRLSVLRSPAFAFHEPRRVEPSVEYSFIDQGEQRFRYALLVHGGVLAEAEVSRRAFELNAPVVSRIESAHAGSLLSEQGFLEVESGSVLVGAVKVTEDGDDVIVRLVETAGVATVATLRLFAFGPAAKRVDVSLQAHEIKSLRIAGEQVTEVNLLEQPS
jgi:alpha-mannosidase